MCCCFVRLLCMQVANLLLQVFDEGRLTDSQVQQHTGIYTLSSSVTPYKALNSNFCLLFQLLLRSTVSQQ
jgi:hypothetical protein